MEIYLLMFQVSSIFYLYLVHHWIKEMKSDLKKIDYYVSSHNIHLRDLENSLQSSLQEYRRSLKASKDVQETRPIRPNNFESLNAALARPAKVDANERN